jgi:SagB-type dehydrogenase family enzyme
MSDQEDRIRTLRRFLSADNWEEYVRKDHQTDLRNKVPAPPVQKEYSDDARLVDLPPADSLNLGTAPLRDIIKQRASRRKFTADPLSLEELSFLLWATQGVRKAATKDDGILRTYRTVPSGGARHPFETYLVINRVTGVEPGFYRYLPLEHKLVFERTDPKLAANIAQGSLEQKFIADGAVIFIWTTIPYRSEWRYTIVAAKIIALDVGHLAQNLYLASEAIGAGTCAIGAYHQKQLDDLIGVDGEDEFVIYLAPVGKPA